MGRAGEAIDAAMLAALIRVDRAVEPDVGRGVAGDDLLGRIDAQDGLVSMTITRGGGNFNIR